jgi:hypothetical protein
MELRSCYFCGVAGRTVESRTLSDATVALCPRCEEKLARLRDATDDGGPATAPVTFDTRRETDGADDGETAPAHGGADGSGGESSAERTDEPAPDETADPSAPDETADDTDSSGLRGLGAGERGRRSTYRKALRLLRNREFPMARSDTVDLLASAYDLDREECERLLDLCVDRGLLAEVDGELREP